MLYYYPIYVAGNYILEVQSVGDASVSLVTDQPIEIGNVKLFIFYRLL